MTRRFAFCLILLIACSPCCSSAEEVPHYLFCVIQNPIHPGKDPVSGPDYAQDACVDARELTIELSQRERDGQPVTAVSLTRESNQRTQRSSGLAAATSFISNATFRLKARPYRMSPGPAYSLRDQEMIMYTLRSHDFRKKILSAMVPPTTYRGRSERPTSVPYPLIADAVLKKVAMRNTPDQKRRWSLILVVSPPIRKLLLDQQRSGLASVEGSVFQGIPCVTAGSGRSGR